MTKQFLVGVCVLGLGVGIACSNKQTESPVGPSAALGTAGAASDGSTLKVPAPTLVSPVGGVQPDTDKITLVLNGVGATYTSVPLAYEIEIRNAGGTLVDNPKFPDSGGTTSQWTITATLTADSIHSWRARATYKNLFGPWSPTTTFKTPVGEGRNGQKMFIPLTDGKAFADDMRGGQFIAGVGWQSNSHTDSLDWDIQPTCTSCQFEFDITNIGPQEGLHDELDLKFVSFGDKGDMFDFGTFRGSKWKMHFIQRADFPNGLEIVWRNGLDSPDTNPGDHRIKMTDGGPDFKGSFVTHFVLKWTPAGYSISASTNGGALKEYMADGFGGLAYNPPVMRLELGCFPRSESFIGAIYRNIRLFPISQ